MARKYYNELREEIRNIFEYIKENPESFFNHVIQPYIDMKYDVFVSEAGRIAKGKSLRSAEKWVKEAVINELKFIFPDVSVSTITRNVKKLVGERQLKEIDRILAKQVKEYAQEIWSEVKREKTKRRLKL